MIIKPAKFVSGTLRLPGDKSISHRAAMFAAMAEGTSVIENFAASADCSSTLNCLERLGAEIDRTESKVTIRGVGSHGFSTPTGPLDCGNSGTTMRLMSGILVGYGVGAFLIGDKSLSSRPMKRVIEPLTAMGANIVSDDGHAPLEVKGGNELKGRVHTLNIASAQIKSCIILAGLNATGQTTVIEPTPTRDHTERMLQWFGVDVDNSTRGRISINGGQQLQSTSFAVPGDISSAAFFLVAAACFDRSDLTIRNVGINPSRTGIIDILRRCGVNLTVEHERTICNEPVGDIRVRGPIRPSGERSVISGDIIANAIDEIPVLAVLGTQLPSGIEIRDACELRFKESDRIMAVVANLRRMGADVEERSDGMIIGNSSLTASTVDSFGDHRIAMAFAIAGLLAKGETEIIGADCVNISFPGFFETLESIVTS